MFKSFLYKTRFLIGNKILNASIWLILGQIISKIIVLIGAIVVARIIGNKLYGEFAILKSTINTFTTISSAAFGIAATKYISEYRSISIHKVSRIISLTTFIVYGFSSILTILIIIFSSYLSLNIFNTNQLDSRLKISALILLFSSLNGLQQGLWMGFEKFKLITLVNLIAGLLSFLFQSIGAYYFGLTGALLGYGSLFIIQFICNYILLKNFNQQNGFIVSLNGLSEEIPIVWKYILPTMLSGLIVMPVIWICNTFLIRQSNGFSEMANFDVAMQWQALIIFIPSIISKVIFPFMSKLKGENKSYKKLININIYFVFILTLFLSCVICFFSDFILILYGDDFTTSHFVFIIVCVTGIFISLNSVLGQVIATEGKMWFGLYLNFIWGFLLFILSYILIAFYQTSLGLALAYLISYIILFLIQIFFYRGVYLQKG